ncbi:MAG: rod shape-determining protein [Deltaproteobacteria bacterium]|nr:rod shape-determining protein [Deltaproteobacteria bacterium]
MNNIHIENIEIVGFDFGHGETALARVSSLANGSEPEMLEIFARKSQVTALAFKPESGDLVGDQALKTTGITELHIGFKPMRHNLSSPEHQHIVKRFVKKYLDILEESGQISGRDRTLFVVGSPSGWSDAERVTYSDILKQAGMQRVTVEKESRAAFLHLKESGASEVDAQRLMQNVLIIDIGSSTTDFTIVSRMEARPIADFGLGLGAGLIEEMIFERTLLRMEKDNPDDMRRLEGIFQNFPHFKRQCIIACREGKEKYFSIPELYISADQPVDCSLKFRTINPPIEFEPAIYRDEMEKILTLPMKALNGQSWKDAFRAALAHAKSKTDSTRPDLVVLTGGASRMDVVLQLCSQAFSSAEKIIRGLEPEFTIARGLARIGRTDILSSGLKKAIETIGDSSDVLTLVEQRIPGLINSLSEPLADELITHAVGPSLAAWREGRLRTLNDIRPDIESRKKNLSGRIRGEDARKKLDAWLNNMLLPALADFTDPVCRQFDIPRSVLDLRNRDIATGVSAISHPPFNVNQLIRNDEIIVLTSMLAGTIVGMASGGTGLTLFHLPIAGQVIAAVIGAIITGYGVDAVTGKIKDRELPGFFRKWVLPDSKLEHVLAEQRSKLRNAIIAQMTDDPGWKKKLAADILCELKQVLDEQVEKAVMWIR